MENMKGAEMPYQIRTHWQPGDFGQIVLAHGRIIAEECGFDHRFECYVAKGLLEFFEDPNPANRFWLVIHQEKLKGSIFLHVQSPRRAQLRWFWLHPDLRGLGLGRRLLRSLVAEARSQSLSRIYLWTVSGLHASARLYRKAGFQLTQSASKRQWGRKITEQKLELELASGERE
jgi:N-acetylglutamate synthase-like GNAT family acetyltransferase